MFESACITRIGKLHKAEGVVDFFWHVLAIHQNTVSHPANGQEWWSLISPRFYQFQCISFSDVTEYSAHSHIQLVGKVVGHSIIHNFYGTLKKKIFSDS